MTSREQPAMQPCPWCRERGIVKFEKGVVWCFQCATRSGTYKTNKEAISAWNRRSPSAQEEERDNEIVISGALRIARQNAQLIGLAPERRHTIELLDAAIAAWNRRPPGAREEELQNVLKAYEQWEADMILAGECWVNGLPRITQTLWDRFIEIQAMRNRALAGETR
jgi:hypothetical protein